MSPEQHLAAVERFDSAFAVIQAADRVDSHESFEVQAVTRNVGRDPVALFQWVRDQTIWTPYHGSLRGETGVLMDRMGNSLDRALLLAALLKDAGHTVRLAKAELTADRAKKLLPNLRIHKRPFAGMTPQPATQAVTQPAVFQATDRKGGGSLQFQRVSEKMAERLAAQVNQVGTLLKPSDPAELDADHQLATAAAEAALRDHWWVQRQEGAAWIDLDPLLPDAIPGAAVAPAAATMDPGALPAQLCHRVEVRVITERWEGGGVNESVVLREVLRPSQLIGQTVTFQNVPLAWPTDFSLATEADPMGRLKAAAVAQHEWLPLLTIGTRQITQSSFTDDGAANAKPAVNAAAREGKAANDAANTANGALKAREPDPRPAAPASHLTAEWLEFEILTPGQPPLVIRRQVFDLFGPAARKAGGAARAPTITDAVRLERALALLTQTEILALPCQVSTSFVSHFLVNGMLANRDSMRALLRGEGENPKSLQAIVDGVHPILSDLYNLALLRHHLSPVRAAVFFDQLQISCQHQFFRIGANGAAVPCKAFDIVSNATGVHRGSTISSVRARLAQGVVDTNAEAVLTTDAVPGANAADGLWAADQRGDDWLTLTNPTDARLAANDMPEDSRARIRADLEAGYQVLCPNRVVAAAGSKPGAMNVSWWRVDPRTGQTLGIGPNGWGVSIAEYAMTYVINTALFFAACVAGATAGAGGIIPVQNRRFVGMACLGLAVFIASFLVAELLLAEAEAEAAAEAAHQAQWGRYVPAMKSAADAYQKMAGEFMSGGGLGL
jgi:hypothetical protein